MDSRSPVQKALADIVGTKIDDILSEVMRLNRSRWYKFTDWFVSDETKKKRDQKRANLFSLSEELIKLKVQINKDTDFNDEKYKFYLTQFNGIMRKASFELTIERHHWFLRLLVKRLGPALVGALIGFFIAGPLGLVISLKLGSLSSLLSAAIIGFVSGFALSSTAIVKRFFPWGEPAGAAAARLDPTRNVPKELREESDGLLKDVSNILYDTRPGSLLFYEPNNEFYVEQEESKGDPTQAASSAAPPARMSVAELTNKLGPSASVTDGLKRSMAVKDGKAANADELKSLMSDHDKRSDAADTVKKSTPSRMVLCWQKAPEQKDPKQKDLQYGWFFRDLNTLKNPIRVATQEDYIKHRGKSFAAGAG